jgi:hypothetical protein
MTRRLVMVVVAAAFAGVGLWGCVFYLNPQCNDLIRNGDETDIDCGGTCGTCALGHSCNAGTDCDNGNCVDGTCTPLPCVNGVKDGEETDVDCGGGTCRKCAGGRHCVSAADCFSDMCDVGTRLCYSLTNMSFDPVVIYPVSDKPYVMLAGDINKDGKMDLAVVREYGDSVTVFLGRGDGGLDRVPTDFPVGAYPTGAVLVDMNHDGKLDVVTANYHGNSVSVLIGVGDGTFLDQHEYPTLAGAETSNLAVGDLDGDGNIDVIATNPQKDSFSQFMGHADGTLDAAIDVRVGVNKASEPYAAAIGDFDGDGVADVAVALNVPRTVNVKLGLGGGRLAPEVPYPINGGAPFNLIASDLNLDGVLDLVCSNRGSDDVTVLIGRGDGRFEDARVSPTGMMTGPYAVHVGDFNRDGVPDLVTANFVSGTASILLGVGDGTYDAPIDVGHTGTFSYSAVAVDLNGDGRPDLAVANAGSNDIGIKLSTSH